MGRLIQKKLILLSYLSYLFRLRLSSEDSCLLEGLQSANKNTPKSKVTKRTHFYWKWKPLSCFFPFGIKTKNLYLLTVYTTIGRYQRTNRPILIIGKTADNRPITIIG